MMSFLKSVFQRGDQRYRPHPSYGSEVFNLKFLASLIGFAAILLPIFLLASTAFGLCRYDSISHYYYAPFAGDIFVGMLFAVSALMLGYRGQHPSEAMLARLAAIFALGVVLFPTRGQGCQDADFFTRTFRQHPTDVDISAVEGISAAQTLVEQSIAVLNTQAFNTSDLIGTLHFVSAGLLFCVLFWFSFAVFTRPCSDEQARNPGDAKKLRNKIYNWAAFFIFAMILILLSRFLYLQLTGSSSDPDGWWQRYNVTFALEAIALIAFGVSWAVKGRVFGVTSTVIGRKLGVTLEDECPKDTSTPA